MCLDFAISMSFGDNDLGIYKGFDNENRSGVTLHTQPLFMVKPLTNFQICYSQKIKITNTTIMKICR